MIVCGWWSVRLQKSGADTWLDDICIRCLSDFTSADWLYWIWSLCRARHWSGSYLLISLQLRMIISPFNNSNKLLYTVVTGAPRDYWKHSCSIEAAVAPSGFLFLGYHVKIQSDNTVGIENTVLNNFGHLIIGTFRNNAIITITAMWSTSSAFNWP